MKPINKLKLKMFPFTVLGIFSMFAYFLTKDLFYLMLQIAATGAGLIILMGYKE